MIAAARGAYTNTRDWRLPLILLFASIGICSIGSHAQGQTPTSPRDRPTTQQPGTNTPNPPAAREEPRTRPVRGLSGGNTQNNNQGGVVDPFGGSTQQEEATREDGRLDRERSERERPERERRDDRSETPEAGESAAEGAARTEIPRPAPTSTPVTSPGGPAGGGTSFSKGGAAAVSSVGEGTFEPVKLKPVTYGDPPEEGEIITYLEGPMALNEFLQAIHLATEWNVLATEAARQLNLEFIISNKTPKEALDILKFHDLVYDWDEESRFLSVRTKEEWQLKKFGEAQGMEFDIKHADVGYMESLFTSLLSATGRIVTDQRTNRIYVWDTQDNLEQMAKTYENTDVPLKKREFSVRHADLADIEAVVSGLLSPNGSVLTDARTGQLIVWDGSVVLDQVSDAVDRLDVPVETRTYQIIEVNAEDLVESIETLQSERGMIQVDPRFNTLIVTDLPMRLDRMEAMIAALDKPLDTKTWTILYADPDFIADQIELYIPSEMGEVVVNYDVHQVTVSGLPERIAKIDEMIGVWDIKRQQVLIEAFIVEVSTDVQRELNINWTYLDSFGNAPVAFNQGDGSSGVADRDDNPLTIGQLPYSVPLYGGLQLNDEGQIERPVVTNLDGEPVIDRIMGTNVAATLNYLDQTGKVRILNSPRVVVQDGEEALFQNATQVPFVSGSTNFGGNSTINNNFSTSNRVEFIDVGTILSVLPRVSEDRNIVLDVSAEDSTFTEKIIISNNLSSTVPEKTTRGAETQLRVSSGDTVVLGGLRRDRASDTVNKVPVLGDLPLLGRVFRSPERASRQSDLMIFLTATIVGDKTHPESEMLERVEREIHGQLRHDEKNTWGRMSDRLSKYENEIVISIGQNGEIQSEGEPFTVEQLQSLFMALGPTSKKVVVIRAHPRAPSKVISAVTETAMESGLKIEVDESSTPLVPLAASGK